MSQYWEKAIHAWSSDSTRYIMTPSKKSSEMFFYIQEIGHFKAFQPYYTERANQKSYLMKYTLSGTGRLLYKNKEYILNTGDVFFIDCREYQYYETISEDPWEMDWIHLYGQATESFYQEYLKEGGQTFHSDNLRIHHLMTNLINLQEDRNARTEFLTSLLIHDLLNELVIQKNLLNFTTQEIPAYIAELRQYLEHNYNQGITLDLLEKKFMINKYQLNKEFSKFIGTPPIDYLISQRINVAKDLLRFTNRQIKSIALEVGIENTAYFSRLFKQKTGITPNEHRKNS